MSDKYAIDDNIVDMKTKLQVSRSRECTGQQIYMTEIGGLPSGEFCRRNAIRKDMRQN